MLPVALSAVLAALVVGFVFVPLARGRGVRPAGRDAVARAVYRDQLAELARDRERGVIDAREAAAVRREIERRLLAGDRDDDSGDVRARPILAAVLAAAALLLAAGLYAMLGNPDLPDLPYADRATARAVASHQMPTDLNKAVADLEAKLKAHPDNLEGWILLGRSEAVRQHWEKSAEAMRHAMTLAPTRPDIATAYGEMQIMADGGLVTPPARDAFIAALRQEPKDLRALWYLGLDAVQQRKVGMARDYWRKLLALLPANGEEHQSVAAALETLDQAEKAAAPPN
jgi:cytochrome c-type biogenesis protein CcmH